MQDEIQEKTRKKRAPYTKVWPEKNLGELISFLHIIYPDGIVEKQLASDLNQTAQGVSQLFTKDDMYLEKVEQIAGVYGYELRIFYPLRQQFDWFTPPPPRNHFPDAGNLAGLVQYTHDAGWSVKHSAEMMGVNPNVLFRAFRSGNIKVSTLKKMLDKLGLCAIWKFMPKETKN